MDFLVKDDILKFINLVDLNFLIDTEDNNLDAPETDAIAEMYGYLNVRYDADAIFTAVDKNSMIKRLVVDIMLYHMHAKIMPDNIPELRVSRYRDAREDLEKFASGFSVPNLPIKQVAPETPLRYGSSQDKQDFYF